MYLNFFGLTDKPFSITPDPRFLYLSEKHKEGLAHLLYGADEAGSFVVLTGEVGTGKTTLCRRMLAKSPEKVIFALILNPLQTPLELLGSICDEFGISYPEGVDSRKLLIDALNQWLLEVHASGERAVVIIDEAQNLSEETLEQVRLLTNLETSSEKLLKIILIGQPELRELLDRPGLRQLSQRVTARYHLEPLPENEAANYVSHRLKVAGATRNFFTPAAIRKGYRIAGGIPRVMNLVFDRAMTGAYGQNKDTIGPGMVKHAAAEVFNRSSSGMTLRRWAGAAAIVGTLAALIWAGSIFFRSSAPPIELADTPPPQTEASAQSVSEEPLPDSVELEPPKVESEIKAVYTPGNPISLSKKQIAERIPVNLEALLTADANNSTAFTSLFWLWDLDFAQFQGDSACKRARNAQFRCLFGTGELETLAQYKLPAVLELKTDSGDLRQITLWKIDDSGLTVEVGGEAFLIQAEDLQPFWTNNYMIIWPAPPSNRLTLQRGDQGPEISWLRQRLGKVFDHAGTNSNSDVFDSELHNLVLRFQRDQGLGEDGVAGEQTLLKLAAAVYNG